MAHGRITRGCMPVEPDAISWSRECPVRNAKHGKATQEQRAVAAIAVQREDPGWKSHPGDGGKARPRSGSNVALQAVVASAKRAGTGDLGTRGAEKGSQAFDAK